MTFTILNVTFLKNEPFMSYQRFKKGGRVAKSPFWAKSVQKLLLRSIFSIYYYVVMFHMVNLKIVAL